MGEHLGITLPAGRARRKKRDTSARRLDAAVAAQADTREMVEQLEAQQTDDDEAIPSGDELASEIERYLRGRRAEPAGAPGSEGRHALAGCHHDVLASA